ncbi:MAG: rhodanese-like domain-containing protein [Rhodobacteraceae bacterium]|nr:rhodanese-like domain-containing protein [Paracoccaceae bacterium]MCW9041972.1 rhodanese-like domain-containing protein [Pseudopelagicola sp.]
MSTTLAQMLEAAHAVVPKITVSDAMAKIDAGALLLDIRDAPELQAQGRAQGAHHVPRGMLEFRADPNSPFYDPEFRADRPVVLYCASGGRAALAGKLLKDMGFEAVYNLGGLKDWIEGGGPASRPVDPGM